MRPRTAAENVINQASRNDAQKHTHTSRHFEPKQHTLEQMMKRPVQPKTPFVARRLDPGNVRDFDTSKIVKNDMHEYLDKDAKVICVSCVDCIRDPRKVLQYKYNPALKS